MIPFQPNPSWHEQTLEHEHHPHPLAELIDALWRGLARWANAVVPAHGDMAWAKARHSAVTRGQNPARAVPKR